VPAGCKPVLAVSVSVTWELVKFVHTFGDLSWRIRKDLKVERHGHFVDVIPVVFCKTGDSRIFA
jgi:hypothetical protein